MRTFETLADLAALVGQDVAHSDWTVITQEQVNQFAQATGEQVNQFAQATGDHQWIHVDVERAKAGPFGAPIAHGFLTLSLIPLFFQTAVHIAQTGMGVNYGLNKVRFMSPVPVGSRLRAKLKLLSSDAIDNGGMQMAWEVTIEREGVAKPACVAESISRRYP